MITVFGSINVDLVCRVVRSPLPGETVRGSDYALIPGGKGANQALAARRAGAGVDCAMSTYEREDTSEFDISGFQLRGWEKTGGSGDPQQHWHQFVEPAARYLMEVQRRSYLSNGGRAEVLHDRFAQRGEFATAVLCAYRKEKRFHPETRTTAPVA